jgi:hypothetical protein
MSLLLSLFVFAVILSAAKDPGILRTTYAARTFSPVHSDCSRLLIPDP